MRFTMKSLMEAPWQDVEILLSQPEGASLHQALRRGIMSGIVAYRKRRPVGICTFSVSFLGLEPFCAADDPGEPPIFRVLPGEVGLEKALLRKSLEGMQGETQKNRPQRGLRLPSLSESGISLELAAFPF